MVAGGGGKSYKTVTLPTFLLKARYDDRRGWQITGSFDTKKSSTTCLKLDMPGLEDVRASTSHNPLGLQDLLQR
jgi:hypothetical protein